MPAKVLLVLMARFTGISREIRESFFLLILCITLPVMLILCEGKNRIFFCCEGGGWIKFIN